MRNKGFTVIEILIVVAIIGILAAVGSAVIPNILNNTKVTVVKSNHTLMIKDLKYGYQKIKKKDAKIVFAITEYKYPTQRALKINKNKKIEMINSKYRFVHSQKLEKTFHDAGLFYWVKTDEILKNTPTLSKNSYPIIIPNYRAIDIDDKNDWKSAEVAYKAFIKK